MPCRLQGGWNPSRDSVAFSSAETCFDKHPTAIASDFCMSMVCVLELWQMPCRLEASMHIHR